MPNPSFVIAADHPSLPGHFPGKPVVPGAVLLDRAIETAERAIGRPITRVVVAKFPRPLLPGTPCSIEIDIGERGQIRLRCMAAHDAVLTAVVECDQPTDAR
jgi:3-hydroxymyristoyl/3-hydroxydecanoyl-(acyl carrier protein) dehydratase